MRNLCITTVIVLCFILSFALWFAEPVSATPITVQSVINLMNQDRQMNGLGTVHQVPQLEHSSQFKAIDMFRMKCFSHYNCALSDPWQYFYSNGYYFYYAGENLAMNFQTVEAMNTAWLNSPPHRAVIMTPEYVDVGVGIAGNYVAVHFGKR